MTIKTGYTTVNLHRKAKDGDDATQYTLVAEPASLYDGDKTVVTVRLNKTVGKTTTPMTNADATLSVSNGTITPQKTGTSASQGTYWTFQSSTGVAYGTDYTIKAQVGSITVATLNIAVNKQGKNITSVVNYYQWGANGTTRPYGTWSANTIPAHTYGTDYLWNYEVSKSGDTVISGSVANATCIGYFPKGIDTVTEYYQTTNSSEVPNPPTLSNNYKTITLGLWSTTSAATTNDKRYVWNVEVVKYSDGTYYVSEPHCAGVQGIKGDSAISYVADLNNEMSGVPCDANNKPSAAATPMTTAKLMFGTSTLQSKVTEIRTSNGVALSDYGITVHEGDSEWSEANPTQAQTHVLKFNVAKWESGKTALPSPLEIVIEITSADSEHTGASGECTFSILPSLPGANGESPIIYDIKPSMDEVVFPKTTDGTIDTTTQQLTIQVKKTVGEDSSVIDIPSGYVVCYDKDFPVTSYNSDKEYSSYISVESTDTRIYLSLFRRNSDYTYTLVDKESVPILKDGENGYGDALQPNLYGYDNNISDIRKAVHTANGFAAIVHGDSNTIFHQICAGHAASSKFPVGVYGISCKVKLHDIYKSMPSSFGMFLTMEKGTCLSGAESIKPMLNGVYQDSVGCGVYYNFRMKWNLTTPYYPYLYFTNVISKITPSSVERTGNYGYGFALDSESGKYKAGNIGVDSSDCKSVFTFDVTQETTINVCFEINTESGFDFLTINGVKYSGKENGSVEITLDSINKSITIQYSKDYSDSPSDEYCNIYFGTSAGAKFMLEVSDLKIERAEDIAGTCSPFAGLAEDSIPQGVNLLSGTKTFSGWTTQYTTANALQGCYAAYANSGSSWITIASIQAELKANTWYTLSWYAKSSVSGKTLQAQVCVSDYNSYLCPCPCGKDTIFLKDYDSNPKNFHTIGTDWEHHSLTFLNNSATNATVTFDLPSGGTGTVYISMPKLEEGDKPTAWQQSEEDRRGATGAHLRPRDEFKASNYYYYNDEYRDFCFKVETAADGVTQTPTFYVLKKKGTFYGGTYPLTNEDVWEKTVMSSFTATDILISNTFYTKVLTAVQAKIDDLVVKHLRTAANGCRIDMASGTIKVFADGVKKPNIVFGVVNGSAVLTYYDNDGNKLYDLGPGGIVYATTATFAAYHDIVLRTISSDGYMRVGNNTTYYKWTQGTKTYESGGAMWYTEKSTDTGWRKTPYSMDNHVVKSKVVGYEPTANIDDGWYAEEWVGNDEISDTPNVAMVNVTHYTNGVADKYGIVYYQAGTIYFCDIHGNRMYDVTSIDNYLSRTGQ